jgi:hypothetical protein
MGQPDTSIPVKRGRKKNRHAGGRPLKFSAGLGVSICNLLRKGYTRKDACTEFGISYQTMYLWLKKGEAEKDRDVSERTDFFTFWDSVQDIESCKRGLCGGSKSLNGSDSRNSGASDKLELYQTGSDEHYQQNCYDEIINENRFIFQTPTEKQKLFLMQGIPKRNISGAEMNPIEVFFNGALGSGKTTGLIMAALQYVHQRDYRALLLRPDYNNLEIGLMKHVDHWLINTGARWRQKDLTWSFPSGARLTLSYLHNVKKDHKFADQYYHFIGCDDLTGFERDEYQKLSTLLRRPDNSRHPVRICSTGNAYGAQHSEWINERFISKSPEEMARYNRYTVSALIEENPHINPDAERIRFRNESPLIQAQLFDCSWDQENPGL